MYDLDSYEEFVDHGYGIDSGEVRELTGEIRRLRSELQAAQEKIGVLEDDAKKWQTLMSCDRIRVIGSAGFGKGSKYGGRPHIGVEFFATHSDRTEQVSLDWLNEFIDAVRESKEKL